MSLLSIFQSGGFLMYPLAIIALINTSLILHLSTSFFLILKDINSLYREIPPSNDLIGSVYVASKLTGKRKFWNSFGKNLTLYERRVYWLSSLAGISTLSGLLGTVIGIYTSFQNMKSSGSASAEVFADGISLALLTTITGLLIAIPSTVFFYIFKHLLEVIEEKVYYFLFRIK